ncbi:60S acidic ribosomal protein P1-2 [Linum perenne]
MSSGEIACSYAIMILHDEGIPITSDKISALVKASGVKCESYWPSLFAKLAEKRNVEDLILNAGAAGGVVNGNESILQEEAKEESDEDMGFSLFD